MTMFLKFHPKIKSKTKLKLNLIPMKKLISKIHQVKVIINNKKVKMKKVVRHNKKMKIDFYKKNNL